MMQTELHKYLHEKIKEKFKEEANKTELESYLTFCRISKSISRKIINEMILMGFIKKQNRLKIKIN